MGVAVTAILSAQTMRDMALRAYVALVMIFLMVPVIVVVLASFSNTSYLTVPPRGFTLRWYAAVLDDPSYIQSIAFSLTLAVAATAGSLLIAVPAAYALVRRAVPQAQAISAFLMAPLVFPAIVIGVASLQMYSLLGVRSGFARLLMAHLVITIPYAVRAILASLAGTDPTLEDAARVLGANRWEAFRKTTLPLIRPGIAAGGLFAFITSFDNVPVSVFLLGISQPTLPVKIFTSIEYGVDPSIAAISTMLIVAIGLCLVIFERWLGFQRFV